MTAPLLRDISQKIPIWSTDRCCHFCGLVIEPTGQPCEVPSSRDVRCLLEGAVERDSLASTAGLLDLPLCRCQVELADLLNLPESTRSHQAPIVLPSLMLWNLCR